MSVHEYVTNPTAYHQATLNLLSESDNNQIHSHIFRYLSFSIVSTNKYKLLCFQELIKLHKIFENL